MPSTTLGKNNHNYLISWNTVSFNRVILLIRCRFLLTEKGQEFVNSIQLRVSEQNVAVSIVIQDNGKQCIYRCHDCFDVLKKWDCACFQISGHQNGLSAARNGTHTHTHRFIQTNFHSHENNRDGSKFSILEKQRF